MKQQSNNDPNIGPYNKAVKTCYFQILKYAKTMLSTIEREELRYTLVREDKPALSGSIIHEMINPVVYLRLERLSSGCYSIHYGFELLPVFSEYYPLVSTFARFIYKVTMANATPINIEDALRVDFIVLNCSEMYEHIDERNKHHQFQLIPYKPTASRRKQMKAVA